MKFVIDNNLNALLYIVQQFFSRKVVLFLSALTLVLGAPSESLNIHTDFNLFYHNDNLNSLEVYYSFNESDLTYLREGDYFEGGLLFHLTIKQQGSEQIEIQRRFHVPHTIADTSNFRAGKSFSSLFKLTARNIPQVLTINIIDSNKESRQQTIFYELSKKDFSEDKLAVSDLQLCSSIMPISNEQSSVFVKNSLKLVPNPSRVFSNESPFLYFYIELYNLRYLPTNSNINARTVILDKEHKEVSSAIKKLDTLGINNFQYGMMDLRDLPVGEYEIQLLVIDTSDQMYGRSTNSFRVIKKLNKTMAASDLTAKEFMTAQMSTMDETQLDTEFYALRHLTRKKDVRKYKKLSSIGDKVELLIEIWLPLDPNLQTVQNESREEFIDRMTYVNAQFSIGLKQGWQTDRGRILITYGPPDQYVRDPFERGMKPHEEWHYHNLQGGVVFVFADLNGFQDYRLIHSTHQSELQNYNWKSRVQR